jgi:hypothetical protein
MRRARARPSRALWPELLTRHASTAVEDLRTPEQAAAWQRDEAMLKRGTDLSPLFQTTPPA